jgi:hypothetical protein
MLKSWNSMRRLATPLAGLALMAACAADDRGGFAGLPQGIPASDAGPIEAAPPPPSCAGLRCSPDLRSILDNCSGAVSATCDDSTGCYEGACIPACESAAHAQGSLGCDFYTTPPDGLPENAASCFAAFVANTWTTPITVKAELGAQSLDISQSVYRAITPADGGTLGYERIDTIAPGEVGIVFLAQGAGAGTGKAIACPANVHPAYFGVAVDQHETSRYPAFRLSTDRPVSAYSIFPYGGANSFVPSATLLLPVSSWRANYVLIDGWVGKNQEPVFVQIVSQADGTEIRVRPNVDVRDGIDVIGGAQGDVTSWTLDRGQVLEFIQAKSMAGSPLEASEPVAVFGGTQCVTIPDGVAACDTLHQQIAPVQQWSTRYSAVPYRTRRQSAGSIVVPETVPYRIVAASAGTELVYDPQRPLGAPAKLESGQSVTFTADAPFTVRSQDVAHPIYASLFMTGGASYGSMGDPDFVSLVPDDQFLDSYVFYVDHTFADSTLTLVRRKSVVGFEDVEIDCIGVVSTWQPLGSDGTVEYATVDLTGGGLAKGTCNYGRHEAHSAGTFGLYVWGMDDFASYGYAAGAGSRAVSPIPPEGHVN